jgi:hypothetical protein
MTKKTPATKATKKTVKKLVTQAAAAVAPVVVKAPVKSARNPQVIAAERRAYRNRAHIAK